MEHVAYLMNPLYWFLRVKDTRGRTMYINPNRITSMHERSSTEIVVYFGEEDSVRVPRAEAEKYGLFE